MDNTRCYLGIPHKADTIKKKILKSSGHVIRKNEVNYVDH